MNKELYSLVVFSHYKKRGLEMLVKMWSWVNLTLLVGRSKNWQHFIKQLAIPTKVEDKHFPQSRNLTFKHIIEKYKETNIRLHSLY